MWISKAWQAEFSNSLAQAIAPHLLAPQCLQCLTMSLRNHSTVNILARKLTQNRARMYCSWMCSCDPNYFMTGATQNYCTISILPIINQTAHRTIHKVSLKRQLTWRRGWRRRWTRRGAGSQSSWAAPAPRIHGQSGNRRGTNQSRVQDKNFLLIFCIL